MGVLMGFAVGYWLGTSAGKDAIPRLLNAFNEIRASDEVKAALQGAVGMGQQLVSQALSDRKGGNAGGLAGIAGNPIVQLIASGAKDVIGRRLAA